MDDQFRALQMDPENGRIYARICYLWSADPRRPRTPQAKRLWDAMADYAGRKAIELAPESPEVWALRAAAFEAVGNDESAEVALERALVIGPENPVAWYVQARLRGQDGDREAAYSAFVHSTGLIPGGSPGAAAEAEPFLPGVLGELRAFGSQGSTARAMALVGRAKIAEGRMMEARWLSDRAVELSQDENPVVWRTRLELDPLTENFERVVLAFSPRPFGGREPGRRELADLDELIDYVQRAGYTQEALKMARAMVGLMCENNPRTTSTRLAMRKLAGRALGSDDWGTAGDVLEVLISDAGEDIETTRDWMMLAACYLWQGKDDEYEALARRMVEHHSGAGDAASLERSAKVFFIAPSQSGPALAAKAANMARKANGIATGAWEWMRLCQGIAEYRVGNREEAQQLLSSASNTTQRNCLALASTFLAMAAQGSGDAIGAEVYLRKAEGIIDSSKISENGDATRDWHDLVFAKVALAEAKQLIREEATVPSE